MAMCRVCFFLSNVGTFPFHTPIYDRTISPVQRKDSPRKAYNYIRQNIDTYQAEGKGDALTQTDTHFIIVCCSPLLSKEQLAANFI